MLHQRTPMNRGKGFRRPVYTPPPAPPARPLLRKPDYSVSTAIVTAPKEIAARPGKRPPTVAERAWMDSLVEFGCVACWLDGMPSRPCAVHHILRGGRRIGHLHTIGLCDPGHHQGGEPLGLISRHPYKARFEAKYGTEAELLALLQRELDSNREIHP